VRSRARKSRRQAAELERAQQVNLPLADAKGQQWNFPPLSFLNYEEQSGSGFDQEKLRDLAVKLEKVLGDFKVKGQVSGICPGPVVTLFEFEPESGTKLSRISGLSDDIAMALRAHKVRIIAPIPGKGCVGIEVPNDHRETVFLKEILADPAFTNAKSKLTMALGKDIEGLPVVMDLAKSPHLLIAGTTGSGKSVSVNAMITSLLYNTTPDEVKLILIDPKQLEFAIYENIPHLLLPVVTDPSKAATALNWAVQEMERRYKLMSEIKVRNLKGYNEKLTRLHGEHSSIDRDSEDYVPSPSEAWLAQTDLDGRPSHRQMYHLVVVVDEFADLMMVAGKEVEVAVARLAQKARASGIHVILATQRPSVDVITGLIKANFPTRISFRLMSGTDSRTVLDTIGSENLLGMGDMLYRPPGTSALQRVHGAFVDEAEIEEVVNFIAAQRKPDFDESILAAPVGGDESDEPVDELYDQAVSVVIEAGFASISMVQRKLRIGYNRSARIVEEMERQGLVGPTSGGSSRREVLVGGAHIHAPM
jgi:S-DNA-T family DNA segregation ATPase FtsK/SpoIIIE